MVAARTYVLVASTVVGVSLVGAGPAVANQPTPGGHVSVRGMECPAGSCETGPSPARERTSLLQTRGWTPETFIPAMLEAVNKAAEHPLLKGKLTGTIADIEGKTIWAGPTTPAMMPASSMKMITALATLTTLPAGKTYATTVFASVTKDAATLTIWGEGDPTLTKARVETLAGQAVKALKLKAGTKVTVLVDDTAFPAPVDAAGWKPVYFTDGDIQPMRPITYNGYKGKDGPIQVGQDFAAVLKKNKATIVTVKRGVKAKDAKQVGALSSAMTSALVGRMLQISDNFIAETLIRHIATAKKQPLTWAGTTSAVKTAIQAAGIPVDGYVAADGSGLSRNDKVPVATLEAVARKTWTTPALKAVVYAPTGVPRSGQTGTLANRYKAATTKCAVGQVWAKTGMLDDAAILAGIAHGVDGTPRVFVLMENGNKIGEWVKVKDQIDEVATAIVGCNLTPPQTR